MDLTEKTISSKKIFQGNVINVYLDKALLPNGNEENREVVVHTGGVCIAALNEKNELYFVRQYRYPKKQVLLELPAGKIEKEFSVLQNAKKELKEETGVIGRDYTYLGKMYPSPGFADEILHMYFCKVDKLENATPDENEFVEPVLINIEKAVEMILNDEIPDGKTQITVLKTYMLLKKQGFLEKDKANISD